jgi:hypothetical protein
LALLDFVIALSQFERFLEYLEMTTTRVVPCGDEVRSVWNWGRGERGKGKGERVKGKGVLTNYVYFN